MYIYILHLHLYIYIYVYIRILCIYSYLVNPVGRLGVLGVVDGGLGEAPVVDELALGLGLEVEEDLVVETGSGA